ncbi:MAG: WD40 repeat domain-containing protein [Candidatus Accumulibacter sp.]|nr:WD40 repeat domain-containing protein [Accumulibacter sp.]
MFAVSPTGNVFATAEGFVHEDSRTGRKQRIGEAQVRIWSAQTGAETHRLPMENDVYAVAFSPDGRHLAARTRKGIVVFRPRDWMEAARFEFTGRPRGSLRFALGGRVVLADAANGVQMWFLESSKSTLLRDDSPSLTYRLSADERWLATFGSTRLRVFDLESGAVVFELQYPRRKYVDMAFVGADDALVARTPVVLERVLWYAEDLIAEACLRFGRDISVDEWNRYIERGLPDAICVQANR